MSRFIGTQTYKRTHTPNANEKKKQQHLPPPITKWKLNVHNLFSRQLFNLWKNIVKIILIAKMQRYLMSPNSLFHTQISKTHSVDVTNWLHFSVNKLCKKKLGKKNVRKFTRFDLIWSFVSWSNDDFNRPEKKTAWKWRYCAPLALDIRQMTNMTVTNIWKQYK